MTAAQLPSVCRLSWRPRTLRHLLGGDSFFSESLETQWSRHPTGHLYCQRPTWARDLRLAVWLLPRGGGQALQVEPTGPSASPPLAIVGAGGMADILSQLERRAWRGGHVLTPRGALPHTG